MTQFLGRYEHYLRNQRYCCSKCDRVCVETGRNEWVVLEIAWLYGHQSYTCSGCLNHFCYHDDCVDEDGDLFFHRWCDKCQKGYCNSCSANYYCRGCEDQFCPDCKEMKTCEGEGCGEPICEDCSEKNTCSFCGKIRCIECASLVECSSDCCNKGVCEECFRSRLSEVGWDEASKCKCGESLGVR